MTIDGLDAELLDFADLLGDLRGDRGIDAERLLAHEGFAGEFQEDTCVYRTGHRPQIISFRVCFIARRP